MARRCPPVRSQARPGPRPARRPLVPIELAFCHGCSCFVHQDETVCPFCGGDLAALREKYEAWRRHIQEVMDSVRALLPDGTPAGN